MNVDLGAVEPIGGVIVSAANLDAAIAGRRAVRLDPQSQFEISVFFFRQKPDVVVFAIRRFGGNRSINRLPIRRPIPVFGATLDGPAIKTLAIEETRPYVVVRYDCIRRKW
jgi:hypothetical protein